MTKPVDDVADLDSTRRSYDLAATAYLARRGAHPVGLDLSPAMCTVAHHAASLPFAAADMTALPIRTQALTGVLCLYAVIHLDAPQRAAAYTQFAPSPTDSSRYGNYARSR